MSPPLEWSTDLAAWSRLIHQRPGCFPLGVIGDQFKDLSAAVVDVEAFNADGNQALPQGLCWTVLPFGPAGGQGKVRHAKKPYCVEGVVRRADDVAALTALWVDLDIDDGSPWRPAGGPTDYASLTDAALAHCHALNLPAPTVWHASGRGLWLLWALAGIVEGEALKAHRQAHSETLRGLQQGFAVLGADDSATDHARLCRVPGSLHPSGERVRWARGPGSPVTLDDFATVRVRQPPALAPVARKARPVQTPTVVVPGRDASVASAVPPIDDRPAVVGRQMSSRARDVKVLRDLYRVAGDRGGIAPGGRHSALRVAVEALRRLYFPTGAALPAVLVAKLQAVNADICRPPQDDQVVRALAAAELTRIARRTDKADPMADRQDKPMSYASLRALLSLSNTDAARLGVFQPKATPFAPARRGMRLRAEGLLMGAYEGLLRKRGGEVVTDSEAARLLAAAGLVNPSTGRPFNRHAIKRCRQTLARFA